MAAEAAILLKDIQGERSGKIVKSNSKTVHVCRGELLLLIPRAKLVPRRDGKPPHNYQLASDAGVTLYSGGEDIAPLSDNDYHLLEAIKSREARYEVFQKDLLEWGSELKVEMCVLATLPSRSPVSSQRAVSIIRYIGPVPNEQGVLFGVEIMEPEYRNCGSTDGYFGGEQFFTCEENCGLFVALDRLLPMDPQQRVSRQPADGQTHQMMTRSKKQAGQSDSRQPIHQNLSPQPQHSQFKIHDRVIVHNKKGIAIHGSVRWMGNVQVGGETFPAIGIETDISVQSKDFEGSFPGLSQHFKCKDSRHGKVVMAETFVIFEHLDAAMRAVQADLKRESKEGTCVDLEDEERQMQIAKKQSEVEYVKGALNTSVVDPEEQARMLEEYKRKQNEKQNEKRQRLHVPQNQQHLYDVVADPSNWQQPSPPPPYPAGSQRNVSSSAALSAAMARQHSVDSPERNRRGIQKMHDQHSVNDEYLLGGRTGGAGGTVPLMQRRSVSNVDEHVHLHQAADTGHTVQQSDDPSQHLYCNIPMLEGGSQQGQPYDQRGDIGNNRDYQQTKLDERNSVVYQQNPAYQLTQDYQPNQAYQNNQQIVPDSIQARQPHGHMLPEQGMPGGQWQGMASPQPQAYGVGQPSHMSQAHGGSTAAVAPQETVSHSFTMGSTVQLQSDPRRYGVIQWIGTLPDIVGRIAGVELEEPMEGCADGIWKGIRYFSCRQGHGFFCPLSSLAPDQRFAQTMVADVNPLEGVALEEKNDQYINPGQIWRYVGEGKGIQGQQNSCYLDSTVFGLFAVSDVFDSMFLDQEHGDPAGDEVKYLLWKGIVNPLRKNGVVRHESVMRLRNKLEELGKMKGVNQDEKDPEEFLNMLFKHTLHVTPFINIKRPFGVEQEYFVQLFVEHDASLKLPTVGDLLERMFKEQKIRFTKVPSKLLIQIPRYGREFKTYQKTIPSTKLELKGLLSSKHQCFICKDSAWKECPDCVSHFVADTPGHTNVVYFCENCAQLSHGKSTGRDRHCMTEVAPDAGRINELDLLSVICIETSHYICFTRSEDRWVFFDSMANRVNDMYNIPKVVDCTDELNKWVYPADGDLTQLLNAPSRGLPEYVRRFTQDIYLCVYIQPDFAMYGDFDTEDSMTGFFCPPDQRFGQTMAIDVNHAALASSQSQSNVHVKTPLAEGSRVQIPTNTQSEPFKYGVIRWIGNVRNLYQSVAGIEMDMYMDGCSDGTFKATGQRFFRCPPGKGMYYELDKLQPDKGSWDHYLKQWQQTESSKKELESENAQLQQQLLQIRQQHQNLQQQSERLQQQLTMVNQEKQSLLTTQKESIAFGIEPWKVCRGDVSMGRMIGGGGWGAVHEGKLQVAVKQFYPNILSEKNLSRLKREMRMLALIRHPNLLQFIAAVFDENDDHERNPPYIITELLDMSLRSAYEKKLLPSHTLLSIFINTAQALDYLHRRHEPIIHRDVSSANVLLKRQQNGKWIAKLSDLGSANLAQEAYTMNEGARVYCAPEAFTFETDARSAGILTPKVDVYSYGIMLCEVATSTFPEKVVFPTMIDRVRREWPQLHQVITECTKLSPEQRPSMASVLASLEAFPPQHQ